MSLQNNSSQIVNTLPILRIFRYTLPYGHLLLVAMTNYTCVKSSMEPQVYKVVSTSYHEISGWTILSRILHSHAPHIEGMNGDDQSNLTTLAFKNREQLEDVHSRIIRLQQ